MTFASNKLFWIAILLSVSDGSFFDFSIPSITLHGSHYLVYEGEDLTVCVSSPNNLPTEETVNIKGIPSVSDHSALGGIDYSPSEISFVFSESSQSQNICSHINIIKDGLDENLENFSLQLFIDSRSGEQQKEFSILACRSGDIILRDSSRDSFSYVEYCHNQEWVTLCDVATEWTIEDATVICRQAELYHTGQQIRNYHSQVEIYNSRMKLSECEGNETRIDECRSNNNESACNSVLVDCGSSSGSDSSDASNSGAIAAGVTIPLLLLLIGGVTGTVIIVFILWKKRRDKLKPNDNSQQRGPFTNRNSQLSPYPKHLNENSNSVKLSSENNRALSEVDTEAEYTAPFSQPDTKFSVLNERAARINFKLQRQVQPPHYEGCNMTELFTSDKRVPVKQKPTTHLNLEQISDPEEYSCLEHN